MTGISINILTLAVGNTWDHVDLGSGGKVMWSVAIGNGRNDGMNRIYGANSDGHIYEFSFSGGVWAKVDLGSGGDVMDGIAVDNGRNDGVTRVYGANKDRHIYEFTYSGGVWNKVDVGSGGNFMYSVAVGNGRNDGVMRIYGANADTQIYEFSYSGGAWSSVDMGGASKYMHCVTLGNGRSDGVTRVYAACNDGHFYEFTYDATGNNNNNNNITRLNNSSLDGAFPYPSFANLSKGDKIDFYGLTSFAELKIYSSAGNLVQSFHADRNGFIPAWDGRIDGGGKAGSGTYIIHVKDDYGNMKTFKVLIVK